MSTSTIVSNTISHQLDFRHDSSVHVYRPKAVVPTDFWALLCDFCRSVRNVILVVYFGGGGEVCKASTVPYNKYIFLFLCHPSLAHNLEINTQKHWMATQEAFDLNSETSIYVSIRVTVQVFIHMLWTFLFSLLVF